MDPTVITVMGVSGVGKDTIIAEAMKRRPGHYRKFVSTTDREPRPGEVNGADYHFVDKAIYDLLMQSGLFLESIEFAGTRYGTLECEVIGHGKTLIMIVVESVSEAMRALLEPKGIRVRSIMLEAPEATVKAHMTARGDAPQQIQARLDADRPRVEAMRKVADAVVVNDGDLETAILATMETMERLETERFVNER